MRWDFWRAKNRGGRFWLGSVLLISLFLCAFALTQESGSGQQEEKLPQSVAPQPVAFSHKTHATDVGLPCNFCHTGVDKGDDATIPSADFCMKCHKTVKADRREIAKLREASRRHRSSRACWGRPGHRSTAARAAISSLASGATSVACAFTMTTPRRSPRAP